MKINRRNFIKRSGFVIMGGAGALSLGSPNKSKLLTKRTQNNSLSSQLSVDSTIFTKKYDTPFINIRKNENEDFTKPEWRRDETDKIIASPLLCSLSNSKNYIASVKFKGLDNFQSEVRVRTI